MDDRELPHGRSPRRNLARLGEGTLGSLGGLVESRLFAYGTVLLLQAKVLWGIWDQRDLTPGDTATYFADASRWAGELALSPDYHPLYQSAWGSMQWALEGAYELTIVHRVLIVLAVAPLVLAVMRRLLSPGIAWTLAVWWVVLPVNYDTLYEVHLFALLPTLGAVLVAARWPDLAGRSAVFAILLTAALLTRSENIVAALVWGAVWIGWELWQARRGRRWPLRRLAVAIALPVVVTGALLGLVAARADVYGDDRSVSQRFSDKHELNLCQVFASGATQRGDVLTDHPLLDCDPYMVRDFGEERPSLREALAANPAAMGEHFAWNARLFAPGLQVSLFNATWPDPPTPDFMSVETESLLALGGSALVLILLAVGGVLVWRQRRRWWEERIRDRAWAWLALISIAASAVAAALLTRPRPSYLFNLTVLVLAVLGVCAMAVVARWPGLSRLRAAVPGLALLLLAFVPNHYRDGYTNPQIGPGQELKRSVDRLDPFRDELSGRENGLLAAYPEDAACSYVGRDDPCTAIVWTPPAQQTLRQELARGEIDYVYAGDQVLAKRPWREGVERLEAAGWERLAPTAPGEGDWALLRRPAD